MEVDDALIVDRYLGSIIGAAVGDSLGAGYEFTDPAPDDKIEMCGGGPFNWAPGEWTDDTQMTIAILTSLAAGNFSSVGVAEKFIEWYESMPPDIGTQTRMVLGSTTNPDELHVMAAAFLDANPGSAGNGALMRTSPIALIERKERGKIADFASEIAALTHCHKDSINACILWSLAIQEAVNSDVDDDNFDWINTIRNGLVFLDLEDRGRWEKLIEETEKKNPTEFNPNGWVVTAFQAALSAINQASFDNKEPSSHFKESLISAIRIGNDTDTVASIAGAYLGARWGKSAIPVEWVNAIHGYRIFGGELLNAGTLEDLVISTLKGQ